MTEAVSSNSAQTNTLLCDWPDCTSEGQWNPCQGNSGQYHQDGTVHLPHRGSTSAASWLYICRIVALPGARRAGPGNVVGRPAVGDGGKGKEIKEIMTETPEDCVRRGAAYLDEHRPGWEKRVDLDTLDMSSPRHCVLGQAYAEEGAALGMTGFDYVVERARSRPRVASFGFDGWGADLLEAAWSAEIIKRRR